MIPCEGTNLFLAACVAAALCLLSYLVGFSCELSWLLEARGSLPAASHILCVGLLVVFLSCTALIYGLATGTFKGPIIWAVVIGTFLIPELVLVIYTITHHWGLQSNHGLTELVGYLVRLVFDCIGLLCVIPLAISWREEQQVLKQLQGLASRLQLPHHHVPQINSLRGSLRASALRKNHIGHQNKAFTVDEVDGSKNNLYDSQSEFDASLFVPQQMVPDYYQISPYTEKRSQSLMDLRNMDIKPENTDHNFLNSMKQYWINNTSKVTDELTNSLLQDHRLNFNNSIKIQNKIYRKSLSLDNLTSIPVKNVNNYLGYNQKQNNLFYNNQIDIRPGGAYYYSAPRGRDLCYGDVPIYQVPGATTSKISLSAESDDLTKYKDVAL